MSTEILEAGYTIRPGRRDEDPMIGVIVKRISDDGDVEIVADGIDWFLIDGDGTPLDTFDVLADALAEYGFERVSPWTDDSMPDWKWGAALEGSADVVAEKRYAFHDFDLDDSSDAIPHKYVLEIEDLHTGDEVAVIVHRTEGGRFPLDGHVAEKKRRNARMIVDALNARRGEEESSSDPKSPT